MSAPYARPLTAEALLREGFPLISHRYPLDLSSDAPPDAAHDVSDPWFYRLPKTVLDVATKFTEPAESRVFALSALTAASIALPGVRVFHRNRRYRPALMLNVVGPAASGKGAARFGLKLLDRAAAEFGDAPPVVCEDGETRRPRLVLPADMSGAGLVGQLEANGGVALIESSELDNLSGTRQNQWGQVDPILRQAAEHESIGTLRKGGVLSVPDPTVAAVLTGTYGQFVSMFETVENGLFSRVGFHVVGGHRGWDSGGTEEEGMALYAALRDGSDTLGGIYAGLVALGDPVTVRLDGPEQALFDGVFSALVGWAADVEAGDGFVSSVYRAAVMAKRYATVVHALDHWGTRPPGRGPEALSREAVEVGVYLALHHLDNAARLLSILPGHRTPVQGAMDRAQRLLAALPDEFARTEAVGVGGDLGYAPRTVDSYLAKLRKARLVRDDGGAGRYAKTPGGGGRRGVRDAYEPSTDDVWIDN